MMVHNIEIPQLALVLLVGASGSGKSTFAKRVFGSGDVISSDYMRLLVSGNEEDMSATDDAFSVLNDIVDKRLARGILTVIDATNLKYQDRAQLYEIARRHYVPSGLICIDCDFETCHDRQIGRDRIVPDHAIKRQLRNYQKTIKHLKRERGIKFAHQLSQADCINATVSYQRPHSHRHDLTGPFDVIGDVHGCYAELTELLALRGYAIHDAQDPLWPGAQTLSHPQGRICVFVGDMTDRGPNPWACLSLALQSVHDASALMVRGNHEEILRKYLMGKVRDDRYGFGSTRADMESLSDEIRERVLNEIIALPTQLVLDDGNLVVAHAGLPESMHGRTGGMVRAHALFGLTNGKKDEHGFPIRLDWAKDYSGDAYVVYGHTPVAQTVWHHRTANLDTGACFGGSLSALSWPEKEFYAVKSHATYDDPIKPLAEPTVQKDASHPLNLGDALKLRSVQTDLAGPIKAERQKVAAAVETASRFAIDPRGLLFIAPTISPVASSKLEGLLEHPNEAFRYYESQGVSHVMCQTKHMGSRLTCLVGKNEYSLKARFGIAKSGLVWSRSGRAFFTDQDEIQAIEYLREAIEAAGLWDEYQTDWIALDGELLPWTAKAEGLIREVFAPAAVSGQIALSRASELLAKRADTQEMALVMKERANLCEKMQSAYQHYHWPTAQISDLRFAPFHVLAVENSELLSQTHDLHMDVSERLAAQSEWIIATDYREVVLGDQESEQEATDWWNHMTQHGSEGMVVKPTQNIVRDRRGRLIQPAMKVRGTEYLRLIYGPEYTLSHNLTRLRERSLSRKRQLAVQEYALGVESLARASRGESASQYHEPVLLSLALEHEKVDPRL